MLKFFHTEIFKYTLIGLSVLALSACQTTLDIAGGAHQTSGEKWYELGRYSSSSLSRYGLVVNAKLEETENEEEGLGFVIGSIRLSSEADHFSVNMLKPDFRHKYICTPVCSQLVEYLSLSEADSATLLSRYFEKYEFDLFKFYGDIYLLDEQINKLESMNSAMLDDYLDVLVQEGKEFPTFKAFSAYLNSKLNRDAYQAFIDNPYVEYAKFGHDFYVYPNKDWRQATLGDGDPMNPAQKWDTSFYAVEQNKWFKKSSANDDRLWLAARQGYIGIGETVCTYAENYFGVVESVNTEEVELSLIGQSKSMQDGVIMDSEAGELFQADSNSEFLPVNSRKTFALNDVAPCRLQ